MKKLILTLGIAAALIIGGTMILLAQTTPDKAPSGQVIVDITDQLGD